MATERLINNGQTTVASAYVAGNTTLQVVDASKLPTLNGSDQYHIVVFDSQNTGQAEIMLVTGVSGNTLTVEPAREAIAGVQTSFNHGIGEIVAADLTVEALVTLIQQNALGTPIDEIPSGTINGSNTNFTLSHVPINTNTLNIYLNGLRQSIGLSNDYTLSGSIVTFNSEMVPQSGDQIRVTYSY